MKLIRKVSVALLMLALATVPVFADVVGPLGMTPGTFVFVVITLIAVIIIIAVIAVLRRAIWRRRYLDADGIPQDQEREAR